jgi:hypothetical protein
LMFNTIVVVVEMIDIMYIIVMEICTF